MSRTRGAKKSRRRRAAGKLILVLGGAASGKSDIALRLSGGKTPKAFVATGQGLDAEMSTRIARHQATRSSDWATFEIPVDMAQWFGDHANGYSTIVIDCVTLWLSNLQEQGKNDSAIKDKVSELLKVMRSSPATIVLVSNELGMGLVPVGESVRKFRDLAGWVNQQIAAAADEVHLVVSGIALRMK
jgi:adenosylcobinamide kinase/adenosylcobinamide-phosphate guanylyltransferase